MSKTLVTMHYCEQEGELYVAAHIGGRYHTHFRVDASKVTIAEVAEKLIARIKSECGLDVEITPNFLYSLEDVISAYNVELLSTFN